MIIIQIYVVVYLLGLFIKQITGDRSIVFKSKTEFKKSFIPFYFAYNWYKKLPE